MIASNRVCTISTAAPPRGAARLYRAVVTLAFPLLLGVCMDIETTGSGGGFGEACLMGCGGGEIVFTYADSVRLEPADTTLTAGDSAVFRVRVYGPAPSFLLVQPRDSTIVRAELRVSETEWVPYGYQWWVRAIAPGATVLTLTDGWRTAESRVRVVSPGESRP